MTEQPTISINGVRYPILCGICHAPIHSRIEADPNGEAGCAVCDNWAAPDEIGQIAAQYAKDEGQMILNRRARDAASKSKLMTFSGKTESDQTDRFIAQLEP